MREYCAKVLELTSRLRDCGRKVDKETEAAYLLEGLSPPNYYASFKQGALSHQLGDWSLDELIKLMNNLGMPSKMNMTTRAAKLKICSSVRENTHA